MSRWPGPELHLISTRGFGFLHVFAFPPFSQLISPKTSWYAPVSCSAHTFVILEVYWHGAKYGRKVIYNLILNVRGGGAETLGKNTFQITFFSMLGKKTRRPLPQVRQGLAESHPLESSICYWEFFGNAAKWFLLFPPQEDPGGYSQIIIVLDLLSWQRSHGD